MPQKRHVSICLRFREPVSPSWPVEVIVPLQIGVDVEVAVIAAPLAGVKELCMTLLFSKAALALRVMRLLALAQIRRLRSSLNKDFKGET